MFDALTKGAGALKDRAERERVKERGTENGLRNFVAVGGP